MRRRSTKEQIIGILKEFYEANQKLPTQTELNRDPNLPGYDVVRRRLGNKADWLKQIYGDERPPFQAEMPESSSVDQPPQETQAAALLAENDSTKSEVPAQETSPIGIEAPEPERAMEQSDSQPEITLEVPSCSMSNGSTATIELRISLPGRKVPISLSLSF